MKVEEERTLIANLFEMIATTLGVSSKTVAFAMFAFIVFITLVLLFRRQKYQRILREVTPKNHRGNTWQATPTNLSSPPRTPPTTEHAQPTDIELPKAIIKQLQVVVADAGKLKALFTKIDKLDTVVSDIEKLEAMIERIYGLETLIARIERLQVLLDDKQYKMLQTINTKIDQAASMPAASDTTPQQGTPDGDDGDS